MTGSTDFYGVTHQNGWSGNPATGHLTTQADRSPAARRPEVLHETDARKLPSRRGNIDMRDPMGTHRTGRQRATLGLGEF